MIEAEIICDSIADHSPRLTTFKLRYPKFIHGEFMTHRMFSRNASSSRAVPVSKNLEEARSDELRASPVYWGAEKKGMQSGDQLEDENLNMAMFHWADAADEMALKAEWLIKYGVHKSIVNRILEPFLHINVVMTSCEPGLLNFFGLRLDKAAQPEIRVLAEKMWAAWNEVYPLPVKAEQWHLPFMDQQTEEGIQDEHHRQFANQSHPRNDSIEKLRIYVSVARCARVSYLSFETGRLSTVEEDLKLYDRLIGSHPLHASPAEHQAIPDRKIEWKVIERLGGPPIDTKYGAWEHPEQWGNLPGWRQYRKMLPGESLAPLPEGYTR